LTRNDWFRVDKKGLAQVYARRGPAAPFFELISNAWDEEGVTFVNLEVHAVPGRALVDVMVEDNSTHGFRDLDDAYTLFAPSYKKGDAEQRGRFNVGEKLFLALCRHATIVSTGGTIEFKEDGTLARSARNKRERGTLIGAQMPMTREEAREAFDALGALIPPDGITTKITFYGFDEPMVHELRRIIPCGLTFEAQLQTELSDGEGVIRPTQRIGKVEVWDADDADGGWLFEMGIPVVEIKGPFDIDVHQKVPLNVERDNVTPAFLRRLRVHVLNHGHARLTTKDHAESVWVTEAMGATNPLPTAEAMKRVLDLRFGKKRVIYDPSDKEGSELAMSKGYAVVPGGSLPREVWTNVRETATMLPAGKVTPSSRVLFSEDGEDVSIPRSEYPEGGRELCDAFQRLAEKLIGTTISVRIVERLQSSGKRAPGACFGGRVMLLNLRSLKKAWFKRVLEDGRLSADHAELLVHELGHYYESSHLSEGFHESQTTLGVKLAFMVADEGKRILNIKKKRVRA